jgi:hypothetical protein
MNLTKRTQRNVIGTLFASVFLLTAEVHADDYRDARAEMIAAYQAEEYPAMQLACPSNGKPFDQRVIQP